MANGLQSRIFYKLESFQFKDALPTSKPTTQSVSETDFPSVLTSQGVAIGKVVPLRSPQLLAGTSASHASEGLST